MVVMDEIVSIKNFFASYHIKLSTEWLQSCVDWCKEENLPPNYTIKDLQVKVYEQWLLLDLRDVEIPCLPPDLSNQKQYSLNGNYALQMMKVVDISKPKHWQLQRIRNSVSKNTEQENESSKRVLQLTLTDGLQEVEAMEYKPIQCLNLNLTPGIKILLTGPVVVRRGRLMLQSQNVKVLGGEVDELIVPNAAENILASFLKLPLNPKPKVIEESMLSANKDIFSETGGPAQANVQNPNIRNNIPNQQLINSNNQQNNRLPVALDRSTISTLKPDAQNSALEDPMDFTAEEEMRIADEIDMMMEVEREMEKTEKAKPPKSNTPDMFADIDMNDYDFSKIDIPATTVIKLSTDLKAPNAENKCSVIKNSSTNIQQNTIDLSETLEKQNDFFENIDINLQLDKIERESQKKLTPQKPAVLSIAKLLKNIPNISNGKFKIKANFKSIVEKLTVVDDQFHLVVEVEDDSGHIAVKFHNDVVSDLAECCPATLLSLKTGVMEENAEAHRKVLDTLKKLKEKLLLLDSILEVQVSGKETHPTVINILDI